MVVLNFNTSHVTVYRFLCSRNVIVGSNFNTSHVTVYHREQHWSALFHCYFNTSHVTVYRTLSKRYSLHRSNFNTSHVTVYLHRIHTKKCLLCNFNTSHVTVYHYSVEICQAGRKISIHPMLRFIPHRYRIKLWHQHFNTSHVTVYPLRNTSFQSHQTFQYIPCYGLSILQMHRFHIPPISIHPMLRFIDISFVSDVAPDLFQYIPCYGLSGKDFSVVGN